MLESGTCGGLGNLGRAVGWAQEPSACRMVAGWWWAFKIREATLQEGLARLKALASTKCAKCAGRLPPAQNRLILMLTLNMSAGKK